MTANNLLPNVRLSTTAEANELYEFEEFAVNSAKRGDPASRNRPQPAPWKKALVIRI
ncbi:hypothetical protein [Rhodohalobacter sp.]|uniref:hypothetical protein n=1 Tax=Rhodohalobacter sp. TaxID=1974210 RepID=UPI002ACDEE22|nr:hypothetical protein [Rhodohalobacter sp.]MDZ7756301.1 hypothetical protein [Rhodohalobacter sp.]